METNLPRMDEVVRFFVFDRNIVTVETAKTRTPPFRRIGHMVQEGRSKSKSKKVRINNIER